MAEEKIFTIPLRKAFRSERTTRAKKAMSLIKDFLERHMKAEEIKIGKSINDSVWSRGIQKPPRRVRIHATKEGDVVFAELLGVEIKKPTAEDVKKREEKEEKKEEKIKEERKERKKKTLEEEIKEEKEKAEHGREEKKEEPKEKVKSEEKQ